MSPKISQVTLVVKNQAESVEFFTKKVGFEKKIDFPTPAGYHWITVGPKGQDLGLALAEVGWANQFSGREKRWNAGEAAPIVIEVEDCRKTYAELKSRGVGFMRELEEAPFGISAMFADPDGNMFEIAQYSKALARGQ